MGVLLPAFLVRDASGSSREHVLPLYKLDATAAPTVNDDSGDGYTVGSKWVDVSADVVWECVDNSLGAAVWRKTSEAGTVTSVDVSGGSTGLTTSGGPITTAGTITLAGTLAEANGGTGLTSFAANTFLAKASTGSLAAKAITDFGLSLVDDADAVTARSTLGLVIGTNVQAYDAELAAIAGLTSAADKAPYFTGAGAAALFDLTSAARSLLDDASIKNMRATLGLQYAVESNLLYNGDFQVSQRGNGAWTSSTTPANNDNTTLIDCGKLLSDGNNVVSVARVTTPVFTSGFYLANRWQNTVVTANKKFGVITWLTAEESIALRNHTVMASCLIYGNANWSYPNMGIIEWRGTADAVSDPISAWNGAGTVPTMNTDYHLVSYDSSDGYIAYSSGTIAQHWAGVTLSASVNNIGVIVWVDDVSSSVSDTLEVGSIRLNLGLEITNHVPRNYSTQELICQRFLARVGGSTNRLPATGRADGTNIGFWTYPLGVRMRTNPSLAIVGSGSFQLNDGSVQLSATSISTNYSTAQCIAANFGMAASTFTLYRTLFGTFSDAATFLEAGAEL